jgi:RNA polymerase sigma-70 factor, ECF subfamily
MFNTQTDETGLDCLPVSATVADEALIHSFVESADRNSFETLMRRYQHELYNYLRRYLGDDEMAEDAFQLTFVRVFQRAKQFDSSRRFRPWLYGIATHQAIDLKRRNKRRPMCSLDAPGRQSANEPDSNSAAAIADHRCDSTDQLEAMELREQIRTALDLVGEPGRSALELIYLQGMAYRDAADALNIPVGTVKSRVHAAIRKLGVIWQRIVPQQSNSKND